MIKSDVSSSNNFDRPKLLLFKFLAHQIHPFAYAVNTFLKPALDDCLALMRDNPQDSFNILLSLAQTFTRFAPESELIYDDIQQFAIQLRNTIDQCFILLDSNTISQSSQLLETIHQALLAIIQQQNVENTTYTDMYKNMSAALTNLEKINSLPVELQTVSLEKMISTQQSKDSETKRNINGRTEDVLLQNGHGSRNVTTNSNGMTTTTNHSPKQIAKPTTTVLPSLTANHSESKSTKPIMDQMKNLSVASNPIPKTTASTHSYMDDYEIIDTSTQTIKKPTGTIAAFPPRQNSSLFTAAKSTDEKPVLKSSSLLNKVIKNDLSCLQSKPKLNNQQREAVPPISSSADDSDRLNNIDKLQISSTTSSTHEKISCETKHRQIPSNTRIPNSTTPSSEQLLFNHQTKGSVHIHITDEYIREFGNKQNRPALRGELFMTYGTPQTGPQTTCLPIGVGLSYDELTLLSCDVHRSAQNVRLFNVETGQLKHTISSNQQMKLHRPSAVMSDARNHILIIEKDSIYVTEADGRLVQTINHRSVKQLYGIATYHDRYLLTIDSKSADNQSGENCRLLLFDPNNGQLVLDQNIEINRQSEDALTEQYINHVLGKVLPESISKPRFIAVQNDDVYIADLGRSLIYGGKLRNQLDLTFTTVFGGHGRANGEMVDPSGLFLDSNGNVISADSKNDRIQLFSSSGQYKTTLKLNERIKRPSGLCTNRAGTQFFVSCYLAGCVRAFNIGY